MIEMNLQTSCQNLDALIFKDTEYKNVKNCIKFFNFR